jgi:hypothetical protein
MRRHSPFLAPGMIHGGPRNRIVLSCSLPACLRSRRLLCVVVSAVPHRHFVRHPTISHPTACHRPSRTPPCDGLEAYVRSDQDASHPRQWNECTALLPGGVLRRVQAQAPPLGWLLLRMINSSGSPHRTARWLNIAVNALLVLCGAGGDRGPGWRACTGGQKLNPSVTSSVSHSAQALDDFQAPWIIILGPPRVASSLAPSSISFLHVWGWGSSGRCVCVCVCVCVCLYCLWSPSDRLFAYMQGTRTPLVLVASLLVRHASAEIYIGSLLLSVGRPAWRGVAGHGTGYWTVVSAGVALL